MQEFEGMEEIEGTITSVVYANQENGYTVLRVDAAGGGTVTVIGTLPAAAPGETLHAFGNWTCHPSHGKQFKAEYAERTLPGKAESIFLYLAGRTVKGIGPATAALIVDRFGDKSLDIIENDPMKLLKIKGMSRKKALAASADFRRQASLRRLMEFLCVNDLRPVYAVRLCRQYGGDALERLRANPYILASTQVGAAFSEADALALNLGIDPESEDRVRAAALFELRYNADRGHCFIPIEKLVSATAALLKTEEEKASAAVESLAEEGFLTREEIAGCDACYLPNLHDAEVRVSEKLKELMSAVIPPVEDIDAVIEEIEKRSGISYAPLQRKTIAFAARYPVMVITGGPGTGKTTSVKAILSLFDILGINTVCAAPTGRSAKRMTELTGRKAGTIHRLLGAAFADDGGEEVTFRKDESDPLNCGAVVLDECSMVDITLMKALLEAMPEGCRLVLVGDADQLPSVGPGRVFGDIIKSDAVPVVCLTEIFRQSRGSRIVKFAHMINEGVHPPFTDNEGDFFFLKRPDADETAATVVELCGIRLPANMNIPMEDIQVLTPMKKGTCGTYSLNKMLQNELNPRRKDKNEKISGDVVFRERDRVMQIRNDYDIIWRSADGEAGCGIYNGDIGYIAEIDTTAGTLTVDFDGRFAAYSFDMLHDLEHAWAMTVHKSQGSEYPAVVLVLSGGPSQLMYRGVLYTAVTRAKKLLVAVGDESSADRMVDNLKQFRRYSGLRARLAAPLNTQSGCGPG